MFVHAKNAPMRRYEEICIFSDGVINHKSVSTKRMTYNPQGLTDCEIDKSNKNYYDPPSQLRAGRRGDKWTPMAGGYRPSHVDYYIQEQTGYPSDVLNFDVEPNGKRLHPTQKPVDLLEYLIKTYTNEGETVLDATMGSGSTGGACINTGRKFIGFELEKNFFDIAKKRIDDAIAKKEQALF